MKSDKNKNDNSKINIILMFLSPFMGGSAAMLIGFAKLILWDAAYLVSLNEEGFNTAFAQTKILALITGITVFVIMFGYSVIALCREKHKKNSDQMW